MNTKIRRILLFITLAAFLLITPGVLCYSWGYTFDWESKKPVLTGGFYFKSQPDKAKIYLDGKFKKNTPALVKRLVPKEYQVTIKKQNYHLWQKNLKIEPELITEAKNILLIPKEIRSQLILPYLAKNLNLDQYISKDKEEFSYYLQKPSYIIYRVNQDDNSQEQLNLSPLPKEQNYQIISSQKQVALLSEQNELYLYNPEKRNFELISYGIQGAQFSNDGNKLLFYSNSEISVYYLKSDSSQPQKQSQNKELITRLSHEIKQAIWYQPTNYHILFLTKKGIQITELDDRYPRNTYLITKNQPQKIVCCSKEKEILLLYENRLEGLTIEEE